MQATGRSTCRFCAADDTLEPLVIPCYCPGNVSQTHRSCIEKRILLNRLQRCYLCSYYYRYKKHTRPVSAWASENRPEFLQLSCVVVEYICDMLVIVTSNVYGYTLILQQEPVFLEVVLAFIILASTLFWIGYLVNEFWICYRPLRQWMRNHTTVSILLPTIRNHLEAADMAQAIDVVEEG